MTGSKQVIPMGLGKTLVLKPGALKNSIQIELAFFGSTITTLDLHKVEVLNLISKLYQCLEESAK